MRLIHGPIGAPGNASDRIIKVDRLRLAKRRWRGFADDGTEFGFDLETPLKHGSVFFSSAAGNYRIEQQTEPVIDIACPTDPAAAARFGWLLGNLHFPIEILPGILRICDDTAVRQMLQRESIPHSFCEAVFQPIAGGHSHGG